MNIAVFLLASTVTTFYSQEQKKKMSVSQKLATGMVIDQFLTMDELQLTAFAEKAVDYLDVNDPNSTSKPTRSPDQVAAILLGIQDKCKLSYAISGMSGVMDVLRDAGINFKMDVTNCSKVDDVMHVTERGWDWVALRNWVLAGGTVVTLTFLGMKIYGHYKEVREERDMLRKQLQFGEDLQSNKEEERTLEASFSYEQDRDKIFQKLDSLETDVFSLQLD